MAYLKLPLLKTPYLIYDIIFQVGTYFTSPQAPLAGVRRSKDPQPQCPQQPLGKYQGVYRAKLMAYLKLLLLKTLYLIYNIIFQVGAYSPPPLGKGQWIFRAKLMAYLKLPLLKTPYLIYDIIFQVGAYFTPPQAPPRRGQEV